MSNPPGRRWYQFSLTTLLAVVTALAALLAYHANWVRQRHEFLASDGVCDCSSWNKLTVRPAPPLLLRLFGERGVAILLVLEKQDGDTARGEALFPEARLQRTATIIYGTRFITDTF